ncbi:MAG TPA: hypothetical protein VF035_09785 [Longimicrobiales bacterium]
MSNLHRIRMSASHWTLYLITALIALGAILHLYHRREPAGRGRTLLAVLRWGALALLILLLFDPRLANPLTRPAARGTPVLLDNSLSMLLPGTDGSSRWNTAVTESRKRAAGSTITLFGDASNAVRPDSLASLAPTASASRLLPAIQAAAEAGAARVAVVTDGGIADADAVARWLARLGVGVDWVTMPAAAPNVLMTTFEAPAWAEAGKPVDLRIAVEQHGDVDRNAGDSASIVARQDGRVIGTARIALPAVGRATESTLRVQPQAPAGGGVVHLEATVETDDRFRDDNVRHAYVQVSAEPSGIVLVSMSPDWEPRFLLPVLERAIGLPARGYLRTPDGAWLRAGGGMDAGQRLADPAVRGAVQAADVLVVHNLSAAAPSWLTDALLTARRVLVLPATDVTGIELPAAIGRGQPGDWFVSAEVPASPVAPLITGMRVDDAPPLAALHTVTAAPGTWTPMVATLGRRGTASPLAIVGETEGRRWAVGLAEGYWRWAFRGGAPADIYNRLWSSVGGWLVQGGRSADIAAVRPVERVTARGEGVRWVARGGRLDSVRVRMRTSDGAATESVVRADRDTAVMPATAPGTYRYEVTGYAGDATITADGELTVETYSPEFARTAASLPDAEAKALRELRAGRDTKPLHASPFPYALLLLLLSAEWILRRRWGLR